MKEQEIIGRKFGRLTVIGPDETSTATGRNKRYICRCDCGNVCSVKKRGLQEGTTKSCGCLQKERQSQANIKEIAPGTVYGRLTVKESVGSKNGEIHYRCICECGNEAIVSGVNLRKGATQSCGCLRKERQKASVQKHGGYKTRLYRTWDAMIQRCTNKNHPAYHYYGARGITVCDEWRDSFEAFRDWAQESGYRDDLTIDRINVDGNYDPGNCRWATRKEQMHNTRRCHYITVDGVTKDLTQWAQTIGLSTGAIGWAIQSGKDPAEYIKEKMQERGGNIE